MKRTKEEIEQVVDAIKKANTAGWVCDSVQGCDSWQPTPENINALPEPLRKYIHDLVACSPSLGAKKQYRWTDSHEEA